MRLLTHDEKGNIMAKTFKEPPPYAILSHTWDPDNSKEVSFQDLVAAKAKDKIGYDKIRFCERQAAADGLKYFWIDTCCIDKSNQQELQTAINSMFRWYQRASRCYVYMSDVQIPEHVVDVQCFQIAWEDAFRRSRWFTRGWTLQELLAPSTVEFFAKDGKLLGGRNSLELVIHEVTGVPISALRKEQHLTKFSVPERISWAAKRKTTYEEDKVYCLLGIFNVFLPLLYGEGEEHATQRLEEAVQRRSGQEWRGRKSLLDQPVSSLSPFSQNEFFADEQDQLKSVDNLLRHQSSRLDSDGDQVVRLDANACLRSLGFSNLDTRKKDIAVAHPTTCDWLFETTQFCEWSDRTDLSTHNGVLWIKGKPGAGKSTLMKHTLQHCKDAFDDQLMVSYFFNARGDWLEQTPLGMLRSIVYQLFQGDESFRTRFMAYFRDKQLRCETGQLEWRLPDLQDQIISEIMRKNRKPVLLLVDALDECSDDDGRRYVVGFLEDLSVKAAQRSIILRICLSSRHYPEITMRKKLELDLDSNHSHSTDIFKYISDKLSMQNAKVHEKIHKKANDVFLWAILVVAMLNKDFDAGRIEEVQEKLDSLPDDLENMFDIMLAKDGTDRAETVLMLQWVLFSPQPLKPEELFFAVVTKTVPRLKGPWDRSIYTTDLIRKRIVHASRGLIEIRSNYDNVTVQFIHRSVNDFLHKNGRLKRLDPTLGQDVYHASHKRLWLRCWEYIKLVDMARMSKHDLRKVDDNYPFMKYATMHVLGFANKAQPVGDDDDILRWIQAHNEWFGSWSKFISSLAGYGTSKYFRFDTGVGLLYILAQNKYDKLAPALLAMPTTDVHAKGGYLGYALQAASVRGSQEIVKMLLDAGADVHAQGGHFGNALQAASVQGMREIAQMLVDTGADVHAQGGEYHNALQAAAWRGSHEVVQVLLDAGADVRAEGGQYGNALQAAAVQGSREVVQILLDAGADVNAQGGEYENALQAAAWQGSREVLQILLDAGADVRAIGGRYGHALHAAAARGFHEIVQMLLDAGADVNAQGGAYGNALQAAVWQGSREVVQILLNAGADVCAQGGYFGNALQAASLGKSHELVQLLLDAGADVHAHGGKYGSALQAASKGGSPKVMQILLDAGAQEEPYSGEHKTTDKTDMGKLDQAGATSTKLANNTTPRVFRLWLFQNIIQLGPITLAVFTIGLILSSVIGISYNTSHMAFRLSA